MEPKIGHVGLTEADARRKFGEVAITQVNTNSLNRFITERETTEFIKIVMDKNDVILGADAIGVHAGEWIQFLTLAIKLKLSL